MEMKLSGNPLGIALDASSEVPIYGARMRLGMVGLVIPLFFYIFIIQLWLRIVRFMKIHAQRIVDFPIEFSLLLTITYFIIAKFIVDGYALFGEFYSPYDLPVLCLFLGMFLGLHKRLEMLQVFDETQ